MDWTRKVKPITGNTKTRDVVLNIHVANVSPRHLLTGGLQAILSLWW
jgi:hypothetical protein